MLSVPFSRLTATATLSLEEDWENASYSWLWGHKGDAGYIVTCLRVIDFHSESCFDRKSSCAQFAGNAVMTVTAPTLITLEFGVYKYLKLYILKLFFCIFNLCVFVLHRRYTNITSTVATDGLLSVAIYCDTGSGILQRWIHFVQIIRKG